MQNHAAAWSRAGGVQHHHYKKLQGYALSRCLVVRWFEGVVCFQIKNNRSGAAGSIEVLRWVSVAVRREHPQNQVLDAVTLRPKCPFCRGLPWADSRKNLP